MKNQDLKNDAQRLLNNLQQLKTDTLAGLPPAMKENTEGSGRWMEKSEGSGRADGIQRIKQLTNAIDGLENALMALSDCPEAPAMLGRAVPGGL